MSGGYISRRGVGGTASIVKVTGEERPEKEARAHTKKGLEPSTRFSDEGADRGSSIDEGAEITRSNRGEG